MANNGTAPPDFSTAVGRVRLNLGDTDPTEVVGGIGQYLWWSDEELEAFIAQSPSGDPRRVAVSLMRRIAGSQALMLKKWSSADLSVDGPAITDALLASARALESEIDDEATAGALDYVSIVPTGGFDPLANSLREYPEAWPPRENDPRYPYPYGV